MPCHFLLFHMALTRIPLLWKPVFISFELGWLVNRTVTVLCLLWTDTGKGCTGNCCFFVSNCEEAQAVHRKGPAEFPSES